MLTYSMTHYYSVEPVLTDGLACFGGWVDLVTLLTLALVTAHLVDADLAAGVRVGALINICCTQTHKKQKKSMTVE